MIYLFYEPGVQTFRLKSAVANIFILMVLMFGPFCSRKIRSILKRCIDPHVAQRLSQLKPREIKGFGTCILNISFGWLSVGSLHT